MDQKNPIQVADRLFLVMETLAENGPMALMELTHQLTLNKSTLHRLLTSLTYMGYVRQEAESGKYTLTSKILTLAGQMLDKTDILTTMIPILSHLAEEIGETVHLVQMDKTEAVYIYKKESGNSSFRMASRVGSRIPLYCSGVGKAILAELSPEQIHQIWNASTRNKLTEHTITDYQELLTQLDETRNRGYAIDNEENEPGVRCIAISIPGHTGNAEYAISISAPTIRMTEEKIQSLAQKLNQIRINISNKL